AGDFFQHVLYARPAGAPDRYQLVRAELQAQLRRMNAVLNAESVASGGPGADYKVLCDGDGQVAVGSFTSPGPSFSQIVSAARAAGYGSEQADYTIFYDGAAGGSCGIASYSKDERLLEDNVNNSGGDYGVVYQPCWFSEIPMHENGHTMGAVQYGTPNSTGSGGHCNEEEDVMCYSPDGGDQNQGVPATRCAALVRFDCNFDDYFDTAPEPGEYLESHWNLGSPLNRFISLGGPQAPTAAELEAPRARDSRRLKHGISGDPGGWWISGFRVRRYTRHLTLKLTSSGDADLGLYVRRRKPPTQGLYGCRDRGRHRWLECRVRAPRRGRWRIGVLSRGGPAGIPFEVAIRIRRTRPGAR
ncbi:MAG: hypothetical protein ACRDNL_13270, partial [Spirillospora sp.]